jgi:sterol 3beta-glucosyltransferase
MKITILTLGTRGDVQPYLALGLGLQGAGHAVTLGTSRDFAEEISARRLPLAPFDFSIREVLEDPDSRAAFVSKRAAIRMYRKVAPMMPRLLEDAWTAAQGSDLLLFHPKILNAIDIAEKLNIPAMVAFYLPALSPTRAFPAPFIPGPVTWGGWGNRLSHGLFLWLMTAPYHRMLNRWRVQALGLAPRPFWAEGRRCYGKSITKVYGYSRHLVPTPPDWEDSTQVTGQWFLDRPTDWQPPPDLAAFLASGLPAIAVGFGSIAGRNPEQSTALVVEALQMSGQRGVLVGGWGGLCARPLPDTVHFVNSVPYDWLFPRVAAVVHHGGAGSTAEGLRAGKPTIVCPFFGDQPFWGKRVHALGVGPEPLPQRRLTARALADAIRAAVTDEGMRQRASALGGMIRTENGVQRAVTVITERQAKLGF